MSMINATVAATSASGFVEAEILANAWTFLVAARTEMMLFVVAIVVYATLFMQRTPNHSRRQVKKAKVMEEDFIQADDTADVNCKSGDAEPEGYAGVERALNVAFEGGDYRGVIRHWNAMKKIEQMPTVPLSHVVESMQRFKKDTDFIIRELQVFLKKFPMGMACINELFESLAKRMDSALMEKIVEVLPSVDLKMDERSYESFLSMYFTTRNFQEVKNLVCQMKAEKIPFTTRSAMVVIKTALKMNDIDEALQYFQELKTVLAAGSLSSTPSTAPTHVIAQVAELACKEHRLNDFLANLHGVAVSEDVVKSMLLECARQKDLLLTQRVEKLAREQGVRFTAETYGLLINGMATDPRRVQTLFDELVGEKGIELTPELASLVLRYCSQNSNLQMADNLYEHMKPKHPSMLATFIRFYADSEQHEKACDIYEQDFLKGQAAVDETMNSHLSQMDARMERSVMNSAVKCGRAHLAQTLLSSSPSDIGKHITMIRNCAAEKNLKGAISVFNSLEKNGVEMNSVIFNTVLDACVECRDLEAAETWMEQIKKSEMADIVSFNTLIKAHLHNGNFDKARSLMDELKKVGLEPNRVTFNELINSLVTKGGEGRRKQMWGIVDEMTAAGVKPNQVTISILLKSLNAYSGTTDVSKTMDLIDNMEEPMDEVLLSSVVEACVRIGKPDLLAAKLKQLQDGSAPIAINGSHTYGSLIKAYGHAKDIKGVWRCWKEMRSRHIKPTSITLGCMVEAVVGSGDVEGAYDLIHQMQDDEQCCCSLNSVIYCSVLKGFCREKRMDRVWAVYEEMDTRGIELSTITCNTLIDACARSSRMDYLPAILESMKANHVKSNIITYSTMIKGHCQNGDVQSGFKVMEQMKKESQLMPDEIMYNSLLDGCAQSSLVDEGLRLVEEMEREGVQPSNFTLSILVKLMNRAKRLDQAFSVVEEITKKYQFRPNVHVYTNLVQACVANQHFNRGMGVLEQMIHERIVPDTRTYAILVRACMTKGMFEQAVALLRGALGFESSLPFLRQSVAACPNLDYALINEALCNLADRGHADDLAAPLLSDVKKNATWCRIDANTQRKVMCPSSRASPAAPWNSARQGKGKGKGSWN